MSKHVQAIPTLGTPGAPHRYRVSVEPVKQDVVTDVVDGDADLFWGACVSVVEVLARTRWAAMDIAKANGYVVKDVTLMGDEK